MRAVISPGHKRRLNRAMHELRRPLQALSLLEVGGPAVAPPPGRGAHRGLLELARSALAELDAAVNGCAAPACRRQVCGRELVLAALERWRPEAEAEAAGGGGIKLFWDAGPATLFCDPIGVSQALDNLISNALEHGRPPLVVTGASVAGRLRITIANAAEEQPPQQLRQRNGDDPRRGHGIEIVSEVAHAHRGRFALCRSGSGCVAALEFPLSDGGLARAA